MSLPSPPPPVAWPAQQPLPPRTPTAAAAAAQNNAPAWHPAPLTLQSKSADGGETHYIVSSTSYLRYYASALRSAREKAPSLLPVLVVINGMPQEFLDWVEAQVGAAPRAGGSAGGASGGGCAAERAQRHVRRQQPGAPAPAPAASRCPGAALTAPVLPVVAAPLQGAMIVHHEVSFAHRMEATNDPWCVQTLAGLSCSPAGRGGTGLRFCLFSRPSIPWLAPVRRKRKSMQLAPLLPFPRNATPHCLGAGWWRT